MKKINLKLTCIIVIACLLTSALILPSCEKKAEENRTAFSPESGEYEIMLNPDEWTGANISEAFYLTHAASDTAVLIYCYDKVFLAYEEISDIDNFIAFWKIITNQDAPDENIITKNPGEFTDIDKKEIKGSVVKTGKRQKVYVNNKNAGNIINEFIYLETEKYFLTIVYGNLSEKFDASQIVANDIISHIASEK